MTRTAPLCTAILSVRLHERNGVAIEISIQLVPYRVGKQDQLNAAHHGRPKITAADLCSMREKHV